MTWSIVAVDPDTGEVGAAAATCTVAVELIHGAVPGKGVLVAQADTNLIARDHGMAMIADGASASEVVAEMGNEGFTRRRFWNKPWSHQQYGVAVLGQHEDAACFTGPDTPQWSGGRCNGNVSVQGNTLRSSAVVDAAYQAFHSDHGGKRRNALADRLLGALEAGGRHGGDIRCPRERSALTAFISVTQPTDPPGRSSLFLVAPKAFGLAGALRHKLIPYSPDAARSVLEQLRTMYQGGSSGPKTY